MGNLRAVGLPFKMMETLDWNLACFLCCKGMNCKEQCISFKAIIISRREASKRHAIDIRSMKKVVVSNSSSHTISDLGGSSTLLLNAGGASCPVVKTLPRSWEDDCS